MGRKCVGALPVLRNGSWDHRAPGLSRGHLVQHLLQGISPIQTIPEQLWSNLFLNPVTQLQDLLPKDTKSRCF